MGFAEGLRKNVHDMFCETLVVYAKRLDSNSLNVITVPPCNMALIWFDKCHHMNHYSHSSA